MSVLLYFKMYITSESKKTRQIAVVIHYCDLSRFFWLRRYLKYTTLNLYSKTFEKSWENGIFWHFLVSSAKGLHCKYMENGTHVKNVKVTSICSRYYNVEV